MQIFRSNGPYANLSAICFGRGRHIERSFAGLEPHSIQVRLHCSVSEFWSHCNVLQELGDSGLSFLWQIAESIDSHMVWNKLK